MAIDPTDKCVYLYSRLSEWLQHPPRASWVELQGNGAAQAAPSFSQVVTGKCVLSGQWAKATGELANDRASAIGPPKQRNPVSSWATLAA
jgi:hypothetical protein